MNKTITTAIVTCLALFFGIYVIISAISGNGNEIANLAFYMSIGFGLVGVFAPKQSMYLLIFLAAYSDLIKRFMVMGSTITQFDLVYVLAMTPIVLFGAVISVFIREINRGGINKGDVARFSICVIIFMMSLASMLLSGQGLGQLRVVADYGVFIFLMFVLPILFPDRVALMSYAKTALFIFIPVAIYGIWQRYYGLSDFEIAYLETGMSTESRQFSEAIFRPFSTLNAASSLTVVMAACMMITAILLKNRMINKFLGVILVVLFVFGSYVTLTRAGWVCIALFPLAVFCVRHKITTVFGYLSAIAGFIFLVYFSDFAYENLHDWQDDIYGDDSSDVGNQSMRITTLSDRLIGFENMKNPDNWQPFGVEESKSYDTETRYSATFSHDMVSGFLFKWGYVPFGFAALVIGSILFYIHSLILRQSRYDRKFSSFPLGACAALLASVLVGGYLFQFPSNIFFWIIVCICLSALKKENEQESSADVVNS